MRPGRGEVSGLWASPPYRLHDRRERAARPGLAGRKDRPWLVHLRMRRGVQSPRPARPLGMRRSWLWSSGAYRVPLICYGRAALAGRENTVANINEAGSVGRGNYLVVVALASMAFGALALTSDGLLVHALGALATSVVPAVLLGLHAQRAQRRSTMLGEYMGAAFVWFRRAMVVSALLLAGAHGYQFALALERAAIT